MIKIFIFSFAAILFIPYSIGQKTYRRVNVISTSKNTVDKEIILYNSKNEDSIHRYESKSLGTSIYSYSTRTLSYREVRPGVSYDIYHDFYDSIKDQSYVIVIKVDPKQNLDEKAITINDASDQFSPIVTYRLSDNILDYYKRKIREEYKSDKDPQSIAFPPGIDKYIRDTIDCIRYYPQTNCTESKKTSYCRTKSETSDRYIEVGRMETDSLLVTDSLERYKDLNLYVLRITETNKFSGDTNVFYSDSVTCLSDDICEKMYVKGKSKLRVNNGHYNLDFNTGFMTYSMQEKDPGRHLYLLRDSKGILKSGYAFMKVSDRDTFTERIGIDELGRPDPGRYVSYFSTYPFEMFPNAYLSKTITDRHKLMTIFYNIGFYEFVNFYKQFRLRQYKTPKEKLPYSGAKRISKDRKSKSELREQEDHGYTRKIEIFYR